MNTTFTLHQAIIWCFCQEDHKPGYKTEFFWYVTHVTLLTSRKQQSTSVHALARGTPNDCLLAWVRIDQQFGYESTGASGTNRLVLDTIDRRSGYEPTEHETTVSTKRLETNTLALMNIFSLYKYYSFQSFQCRTLVPDAKPSPTRLKTLGREGGKETRNPRLTALVMRAWSRVKRHRLIATLNTL